MGLNKKSDDNLFIARYCSQENIAISTGVSRAYYSAFQSAKVFLIKRGVNEKNYGRKAEVWKCQIKQPQNAFAHDSIWDVVKGYMRASNHSAKGIRIAGIGKKLHEQRKIADYAEQEFELDVLQRCILSVDHLINVLKGD